MSQTLLLGLGGTGSRIVNLVVKDLNERGIEIGNGEVCCAVLDTDSSDNEKLRKTNTGISVIPTSKDRTIQTYINMYADSEEPKHNVTSWLPQSITFNQQNMLNGAAQMRVKSRLALYDTISDGSIRELESAIAPLLSNIPDNIAPVRILVVSSLAGGTGSGMFIQIGLWLRQHFKNAGRAVKIRGIFILPDVYSSTVDDIRNDNIQKETLKANAYAALRELNTISKIAINDGKVDLPSPIVIDDLFDSRNPSGNQVYDYTFLVDDTSANGIVLKSIEQYEARIAQLVYMQLYCPVGDDLGTEEDNLFMRLNDAHEPLYGSCGTSRAVYPTKDIINYCVLRATKFSLSSGWRKIDIEIEAIRKRENERRNSGHKVILRDDSYRYLEIFKNKTEKKENEIGNDKLFVNIGKDIWNATYSKNLEDGSISVSYSDKVEDLIAAINKLIDDDIKSEGPCRLKEFAPESDRTLVELNQEAQATEYDKNELENELQAYIGNVEYFIREIKNPETLNEIVDRLIDKIIPVDMGDINDECESSIYSYLTKITEENKRVFVHPIAARCLLYKLYQKLYNNNKEYVASISNDELAAKSGSAHSESEVFDNRATRRTVEKTLEDLLKSRTVFQGETRFLRDYVVKFNNNRATQYDLCLVYARKNIWMALYEVLIERLNKLIKLTEEFFGDLSQIEEDINDGIGKNLRKNTNDDDGCVTYICASPDDKNELYESLHIDGSVNDDTINKSIIDALYACMCVAERPNNEANKPYIGMRPSASFLYTMQKTYGKYIYDNYKDIINLDIYTAICKSSDIKYKKEHDGKDEIETGSFENGVYVKTQNRHKRHIQALKKLKLELINDASPMFSIREKIKVGDPQKSKVFWGLNPLMAAKCSDLGEILGINISNQQRENYNINELLCYTAVYGVYPHQIPEFNETNDTNSYYPSYRRLIEKIMKECGSTKDLRIKDSALINSPHLDKTWHRYIPYLTAKKQEEEDQKFFRMFWLAIAYGLVSLDKKGCFQITRDVAPERLFYQGNRIGVVDIYQLISALRYDDTFMFNTTELEDKLVSECRLTDNYEGTVLMSGVVDKGFNEDNEIPAISKATEEDGFTRKGGLASQGETNAVTMILRYSKSPFSKDNITMELVTALETLMETLVKTRYKADDVERISNKKYELCRRILKNSKLVEKDHKLFERWKNIS